MRTITITCNVNEHAAFNTVVKAGKNVSFDDLVTSIFLHENLLNITCKLLKAKKLKSGLLSFTFNHNDVFTVALIYDFCMKGNPQFHYECTVIESMLLLPVEAQKALA